MQPLPPPNTETVRAIANRRAIANDVLKGKVDLRAYPHRYLVLSAFRHSGDLPSLLAAVEWLEAQSWEVVNMFTSDDIQHNALVRRRAPRAA